MAVGEISASKMVLSPNRWLGVRHLQMLMMFLAMVIAFCLRVNMSMAIVAMTDASTPGAFDWSVQTQSVILSSFFWGYVVLQIPGGELAAKFSSSKLVMFAIGVNSLVTLLVPTAATVGGWKMVCGVRVVQGLTQGFIYPSFHNLFSKWVPLEEKGRLTTMVYAGAQLGTALQMIISGFIADAWGWPAIFYVNGIIGLIWVVFYAFIGSDSPQVSKLISEDEKLYIQTSLGHVGGHKRYPTPWRAIWTSLPFWSLIIAHCGQNWGFWTLLTEMPSYMNNVLNVNIKANGLMSALPYLAIYIMSFVVGNLTDLVLRKQWLSVTATRKIFNSVGHWGPALALIGLSYAPEGDVVLAVVFLTITVAINAGHFTGYLLVHIDMAPNFSGTLMGITNCIANIISIIAPLVVGVILDDETSQLEWRNVFFLSSIIYFSCNLFFVIFGTCETQTWNEPADSNKTESSPQDLEKVA